jgi:hypothetical protein
MIRVRVAPTPSVKMTARQRTFSAFGSSIRTRARKSEGGLGRSDASASACVGQPSGAVHSAIAEASVC